LRRGIRHDPLQKESSLSHFATTTAVSPRRNRTVHRNARAQEEATTRRHASPTRQPGRQPPISPWTARLSPWQAATSVRLPDNTLDRPACPSSAGVVSASYLATGHGQTAPQVLSIHAVALCVPFWPPCRNTQTHRMQVEEGGEAGPARELCGVIQLQGPRRSSRLSSARVHRSA
jgi:hypothetical protein